MISVRARLPGLIVPDRSPPGDGGGIWRAFFMLTLFYFGLSLLVMLLNKPASASTEPAH